MKSNTVLPGLLLAGSLISAPGSGAEGSAAENKQALATSPQALVEMLENVSFLTPAEYRDKIRSEREAHAFPLGLEALPQYLAEEDDPRSDIRLELDFQEK